MGYPELKRKWAKSGRCHVAGYVAAEGEGHTGTLGPLPVSHSLVLIHRLIEMSQFKISELVNKKPELIHQAVLQLI